MPEPSPSDARVLDPGPGISIGKAPAAPDTGAPADTGATAGPDGGPAPGYRGRRLGLLFWLAVAWMAALATAALLAPWLTARGILRDPTAIEVPRQFSGMNNRNRLGTDGLGRDHLARLVWGARVSLPVGFASISLGLAVGATVGLLTGYFKGLVDTVLMAVVDVILAFPALLLALSVVTFLNRKDLVTISLAIGLISIPALARLVRANTLSLREREFVLAARTLGAGHGRIILREILPNVVPPMLSFAMVGVGLAVAAEAALAYVGVSMPPPAATWGGMIFDAFGSGIEEHPFQVFLPCAVLVVTVVALNLIGDRLGRFLDVRESAL